jgi:membrane protease YdiL (CAAX protease family)
VATDPNALNYNTFRPIPGWSLLLFVGFCAGLVMLGLRLWPAPNMLSALGIFFGAGLAAALLAVAPLGRAAGPALGLRWVNWRYAVFGSVGTLAISIGVSQLGIEPDGVKQAMEIASDPEQFMLSLLFLAVLAPLVEELVFRGLLYGWLEGRWGSSVAFVVSSLAFAAAHLEPKHVVLVLPLGLLFGWLRRRSNSLAPSIIAHIVNNGFALTASAYFGI